MVFIYEFSVSAYETPMTSTPPPRGYLVWHSLLQVWRPEDCRIRSKQFDNTKQKEQSILGMRDADEGMSNRMTMFTFYPHIMVKLLFWHFSLIKPPSDNFQQNFRILTIFQISCFTRLFQQEIFLSAGGRSRQSNITKTPASDSNFQESEPTMASILTTFCESSTDFLSG